jgi:hypothetical protein
MGLRHGLQLRLVERQPERRDRVVRVVRLRRPDDRGDDTVDHRKAASLS